MTLDYSIAAREALGLTPVEKAVLASLALYADGGNGAYPSNGTLQRDTALSERSIRNAVRDLGERGLLSINSKAGPNGVNVYVLHLEAIRALAKPAPPAPGTSCPRQDMPPAPDAGYPAPPAAHPAPRAGDPAPPAPDTKEDSFPNGKAERTLKDIIFGECLSWLATKHATPPGALRSYVGGLLKQHGDGPVLAAFIAAAREDPVDAKSYLKGILKHGKSNGSRRPLGGAPDPAAAVREFRKFAERRGLFDRSPPQ